MSFDNRATSATPPWLRASAPDSAPGQDAATASAADAQAPTDTPASPESAGRHVDHDDTDPTTGPSDFDSAQQNPAVSHRNPPPAWLPPITPPPVDEPADGARWIPTTVPTTDPAPPGPDAPSQPDPGGDMGRAPVDEAQAGPPPGPQHPVGAPGQFDGPPAGPPQQFPQQQFEQPPFPPQHQFHQPPFPPQQQFEQPPFPPQQFPQQQFEQQPFPQRNFAPQNFPPPPPFEQQTQFPQQPPVEQQRPAFDPNQGPRQQFGPGPVGPRPDEQHGPVGPTGPVGPNGPVGSNAYAGPPTTQWPPAPPQSPPIRPATDPFGAPGPGFAPQEGFGQPTNSSIDEVALLRKARRAPHSGWRRAVHKISAGAINPGDSPDDLVYQQLVERVNRPVRGDYRIAVLSLKGGVGKTTTTVGLGSIYSSLRGDRVIAVDANPDLGTLGQRIPQQSRSTVRDLLADTSIYRYSDVRAHTSQSPSRLEVLASERDPAVAEAFSEDDYRGVMKVLQRFYNIIITDCGTGLSHSAMNGVLDLANSLILVSSPAIDGARSAGATLDWLQAHGYGHLVSRAVVVLSSSRSGASTIDTNQLSQHFLTRCRAVHEIPFDDHLAEGAEMDLELLGKGTHRAFVELAATVADDFSATNLRRSDPFLQ